MSRIPNPIGTPSFLMFPGRTPSAVRQFHPFVPCPTALQDPYIYLAGSALIMRQTDIPYKGKITYNWIFVIGDGFRGNMSFRRTKRRFKPSRSCAESIYFQSGEICCIRQKAYSSGIYICCISLRKHRLCLQFLFISAVLTFMGSDRFGRQLCFCPQQMRKLQKKIL